LIKTIEQKVYQQNIELANRSKVIEDLKVSLTLLLDKYNELKKNYDKKINTFLVAPMSKNIQNSINKDNGKFNSSRLYIEKSSLQLNVKNNNGPLLIQSFKKKISVEDFEKMNENVNNLTEQLKDKEKYSKMKDAEIKRLELIVKEYELMKIPFDDLNKRHLELKKYNESIKIEVDFFKEEIERLKNEVDFLLREKFLNQDLINNSRKNYELLTEYQNKYNLLEKNFLLKSQELIKFEELDNEQKSLIEVLKEENKQLIESDINNKNKIILLEEEINKNSISEKGFIESIKDKDAKIKSLENKIENYITSEVQYIDMFQQIKEKTKLSYENFHKTYLEQENKYDKKIKELKLKIENIKMKVIKKINKRFIELNNIANNKTNLKQVVSHNSVNNVNLIRKISFQNKFEILGIPVRNISSNNISINNNDKNKKQKHEKNQDEIEEQFLDIIENYKNSVNELKNELKDKLLKIEKHDLEKNKLIYQIQNYERFMKENEKKCSESNEKVSQMELVVNQLNSKIDIMNKENLKNQKNIAMKLKEDLLKEEIIKKDYIQQIADLKNQLQQYKIENQGKSRIIEERNEEIKMLKSQIR